MAQMIQHASDEEGLFTHVPEPQPAKNNIRPWAVLAAIGSVVCMAGAVTLFPSFWQPYRQEPKDGVMFAVSADVTKVENQGCANWNDINLGGAAAVQSVLACETWCRSTPSCTGFNFMPTSQCSGEAAATGSCYLWGSIPCKTEANDCWDNYKLPSQVPAAWGPPAHGKGCKNWQNILFRSEFGVSNAEACGVLCDATAGCKEFGFQEKECGYPKGASRGACYMYNGICDKEDNDCWDHFEEQPAPSPSPGPWSQTGPGKGCSNWNSIKIGDATLQVSQDACGWLCHVTEGCVAFGYQSGLDSSCSTAGGLFPGACYLWSGKCDEEDNACWDNYDMPLMKEYCPRVTDFRVDYDAVNGTGTPDDPSGFVTLEDQGWEITGNARVSTRGVWDMLGGWVAFEMDLSRTIPGFQSGDDQGPNANLYTIFPQTGAGDYDGRPRTIAGSDSQYCDGQGEFDPKSKASERPYLIPGSLCGEMDIIETNSKYAFATTWHTNFTFTDEGSPNDYEGPDQCNQNGCALTKFFTEGAQECNDTKSGNPIEAVIDSTRPFNVNTTFAADGSMTVTFSQAGVASTVVIAKDTPGMWPTPSAESLARLAGNMTRFGAAIESSQWNGYIVASSASWSPYRCTNGTSNLSQSIFSIKNLRVKGMKIRGSASPCSASA